MKYLTFKEVFEETKRLENSLKKMLADKELLEVLTDPKSTDYSRVYVDGGKHTSSVQEIYVLKQDIPRWKDLDKRIQEVQKRIKINDDWVENELKILKEYDDKVNQIVYYKEQDKEKLTWVQIGNRVYLSESQCRRIYKNYKEKRDV